MTNWSNEQELEFLEVYKTEPVVWDPKHPNHKDRKKVRDAWGRISEVLNIHVADLKKKKESLMATFRMHRRKIKASEVTGSGTDDIHKPIWFAFDLMNSFLGEKVVCKTTRNTAADAQEWNDIKVEPEHAEKEMTPNSTNIDQAPEPTRAQTLPTIRLRRKAQELVEAGQSMSEADVSALNKVLSQQGNEHEQQEDECDLYGKLLAKKLRKLPDHERLRFMHETDGVFIRYISANSPLFVVTSTPSLAAHHNLPGSSSSISEP